MKIYYEGNLGDKEKDYCLSCDNNISSVCMSCKTETSGVPSRYCEIGSIPKKSNADMLKAMNVDQLTEWLDKNGMLDNSPWSKWFDSTYCQNCEDIEKEYESNGRYAKMRFAWCEIHNRCKFFPDRDEVPDCKEIVKLWLEAEVEE